MSGPVSERDVDPVPEHAEPPAAPIEVVEGRAAEVGGFGVRRVLPRRARRTVAADLDLHPGRTVIPSLPPSSTR